MSRRVQIQSIYSFQEAISQGTSLPVPYGEYCVNGMYKRLFFNRQLASIYALSTLYAFAYDIVSLLIPFHLLDKGYSLQEMGALIAFSNIIMPAVPIITGYISDRVSRGKLFVAILTMHFPTLVTLVFSWNVAGIVASLTAFNIVSSMYTTVIVPLLADYAPKENVSKILGLHSFFISLGGVAAYMSGGYIASKWGCATAILIAAPFFLVAGLPALPLMKYEAFKKRLKGEVTIRRKYVFSFWFLYFFMSGLATFTLSSLLQVYIKMRYQVSIMEIGFIYTLGRLLFFLKPVIGYVGDRIRQLTTVILLQIIAASLCIFIPFVSLTEFIAILLVLYLVGMCYDIIFKALLIRIVPRKMLGTIYGGRGAAFELAMMIAPALAGFMLEYNPALMFLLVSLLTIAQIPILIIASKTFTKETKIR